MTKRILILILLGAGFAVYFIFFDPLFKRLYCKKQINLRLYSFREAVKKNGADPNLEENAQIKKFLAQMYNDCLK